MCNNFITINLKLCINPQRSLKVIANDAKEETNFNKTAVAYSSWSVYKVTGYERIAQSVRLCVYMSSVTLVHPAKAVGRNEMPSVVLILNEWSWSVVERNDSTKLYVISCAERPQIVEGPKDVLVQENADVTFQCEATGDPQPTIIWKKVDGQMPQGRSVEGR